MIPTHRAIPSFNASEHRDKRRLHSRRKSFDVNFCTVAKWDENGQIIEENLFYDLVTFMRQLGLST